MRGEVERLARSEPERVEVDEVGVAVVANAKTQVSVAVVLGCVDDAVSRQLGHRVEHEHVAEQLGRREAVVRELVVVNVDSLGVAVSVEPGTARSAPTF
ncbi:hypothetical protein OV203_31565 [Nannocystis sp. ILAH1]|uniref:hypothetical protein n=1 Tax=Nannocystis sp. ILAH1 TaxID=2996789 RepID=UPI002270395F|nr:hypothetical protein [Nannocystis sp. ILAH1]MCY0991723.1 hypothetical protein [Nannocystis sp. ILAH1]